jgi:MerR family transcriptional regulator, light-induced transcriptional regulator
VSARQRKTDEGPLLRIGELSRRTGVQADTLRAWERRYGVLEPRRSEGGFRLYSGEDEDRVRAMKALIDSGLSAAEAARLAPAGVPSAPSGAPFSAEADRRLREALERFDEGEATAVLDDAIAALSVEALASRVVLPAIQEVGDRWERGETSIGQEHFATNVVRGRLAGLARNWGAGPGPLAVLACPPGELHDIGLLVFGLVLRARGWRVAYLGANTPIASVAETAERLAPRVIVLAALAKEPLAAVADEIARLGERTPVLLAGAGADEAVCRRANAELLSGDPVGATQQLAAWATPSRPDGGTPLEGAR